MGEGIYWRGTTGKGQEEKGSGKKKKGKGDEQKVCIERKEMHVYVHCISLFSVQSVPYIGACRRRRRRRRTKQKKT